MPGNEADQSARAAGTDPVVLVFGLRPERLLDTERRIDAFVEAPDQEKSGVLVDAITSGLQDGASVVALIPEWFAPAAHLRVDMVRAMLDTHRLAVHRTALPPLAATVLASLASASGPHVPSTGVLASLLPELEAELLVLAWLGSVTGLSAPAPSFGQHVASLAPGSAFGVCSWPEPAVHRIQRGAPSVPLPQLTRPSRLAVADAGGDAEWLTRTVNGALGGLEVRSVEPTPGGRDWWGTGKLVEGVVYPADAGQLCRELVAQLEPWVCRWCRELIARSPCPLCGHRGRPARRRRPAAPQA